LIRQVRSIDDIVRSLYDFVSDMNRPRKPIGTIFISAHGSYNAVALPITSGARVLSVPQLGSALSAVPQIGNEAPSGFTQAVWDEIREPLHRLESNLLMLRKRIDDWIDAQSLIRFWVCNLGQVRGQGGADPLAAFGRMLVPNSPLTVEAPRVRSLASFIFYTGSPKGSQVFLDEKRRNRLHPDVVSEIESNAEQIRFSGQDLDDAHDVFGSELLRPGPPPGEKAADRQWVPVFALQGSHGPIHQGQYKGFRGLWRSVNLPDRRSPP